MAAPVDVERAFAFVLLGGMIALGYSRHRDLLIGILLAVAYAALLEAGLKWTPPAGPLVPGY
jgi:lipopolysaccharide export LptBFGC system permease protein LptF